MALYPVDEVVTTSIGTPYTLTWNPSEHAISYQVQIGFDLANPGNIDNQAIKTVTEPWYELDLPDYFVPYSVTWRVRAVFYDCLCGNLKPGGFAPWSQTATFTHGFEGPAGGFIFVDKGEVSDGWQFLETAPSDTDYARVWQDPTSEIGDDAQQQAVGTGESNTAAIVNWLRDNDQADTARGRAALFCDDLRVTHNGRVFDDWFLPSIGELHRIYLNLFLNDVGGFRSASYWSSTESSASFAYEFDFEEGRALNYSKDSRRVRAVRAF